LHERKGRINNNGTIIKHIKSEKEKYLDSLKEDIQSNKKPVRFRRLIQELINVFPDDGILELEAGTGRCFALQQYIPVKRRNYFVECGFQFIGYGPASALGIKFGRPEQPVISLTGDGAFLLTVQSIITSVIYNIPIVWIILNNYGYNCVRGLALQYFDGASIGAEWKKGEALWSPDYVKLAESFGANGIRVEDPQEIGPALKNAIKSQKTWVIDIPVERELCFNEIVSAKSAWDYYFPKWQRK
jgi:acetolactate synthase-1/2/3 large subunit